MDQKTERIVWLDILKALGVILVVLGHALGDCYIKTWIYSFHLGIFYYVAGYTFKQDKYPDLMQFVKHKIRTILIPYLFYSILCVLFMIIWDLGTNHQSIMETLKSGFNSLIGTFVMIRGSTFQGYCWFLPLICFTNILYYIINLIQSKLQSLKWFSHVAILVLYFTGVFYQKYIGVSLPLYLDAVPIALVLFHLGHLTKNTVYIKQSYLGLGISVVLTVLIAFLQFNAGFRNDLYEHTVGLPISFFVSNIIGIYMALQLAIILKNNARLSCLGKNSLRLYALHRPVIFYPLRIMLSWAIARISLPLGVKMHIQGLLLSFLTITVFLIILPFVVRMENKFVSLCTMRKRTELS